MPRMAAFIAISSAFASLMLIMMLNMILFEIQGNLGPAGYRKIYTPKLRKSGPGQLGIRLNHLLVKRLPENHRRHGWNTNSKFLYIDG